MNEAKVCGFLCLCLPDSTFIWLGMLASLGAYVKMQVELLTETLETQSSPRCGTWPQLMCCTLVAVQVPEVGRSQVRVSEQGSSSDNDQDSE